MASEMVNGVALYYEERGSGQPLLLVHGTGTYADIWSPVLDGLARSYRVIAYDRRGFARSSSAPGGGLAEHARDAAALLDALGASPATVVGWSGGGVIALDLAASFPDCVAELVLAEPAVHLTTHPSRAAVAMSLRSSFHRYMRRDPASAALEMYRWASGYKTGGNAYDALPEAWREQMLVNAPVTLREMDQMIRPYPTRAAIRSIACPVTVIEGDLSDPAFARAVGFVMRLLPQARMIPLPGAAHMLHIDQPAGWVEIVTQTTGQFRQRARATWAAGDWDSYSLLVEPVGALVLDRIGVEPGMDLLDVGTGSGGTVAIPAALRGATVVGCDVTPELFEHARRRAAAAGVEVEWVDADAQHLPFGDASFDRVTSTFGAMFAPDHNRAAAELVRVCRPGGRIAMTTWVNDGFAGELFKLTGSFMPPPPPGVQPPPLWGVEEHVEEAFAAAEASPTIEREAVDFDFPSVEDAVQRYAEDFGPFVIARGVLEPQGRWVEFLQEFAELIRRFNHASDGTTKIRSDYFVIRVER